jgi:hypothetical protein
MSTSFVERPIIKALTLSESGTVGTGTYSDVILKAPSGYYYNIIGMYLNAVNPAGSGSGSHYFMLRNNSTAIEHLKGESTFGNALQWAFNGFTVVTTKTPNDDTRLFEVLKRLKIGDTVATEMEIRYYNLTDVDQVTQRDITFLVEQWRQRK